MNRIGTALVAAGVGVWLGGAVACVDTGHRKICQVTPPVPYAGTAVIPSADTAPAGPYAWKNVAINGGGFVSGIVMSPVLPGLAFARTDVGGAYRFDPANQRWMPITDWVGHSTSSLIGIESIAADPVDPNRVYMAAGEYLTAGNGTILSSTDMGATWTPNSISAPMGSNVDGRSMGERLAIDPNLTSTLYFGSRNAGLWKSTDSAQTWTQVIFIDPATGAAITGATNGGAGSGGSNAGTGYGLTFVVFDAQSGLPGSPTPVIYVGVGMTTGTALYHSIDGGATWNAVTGQPPAGMMPHHAVLDGCGNLYLAYNNGSGPNGITAGAVWRYTTATGVWRNVSPPGNQQPSAGFGFGGIAVDAAHAGTLIVTTIDDWSPGEIYRTTDGGLTWTTLARDAQWDVAGAQYLYWHGNSLPAKGWMGDVALDPFDSSHALFITGQGLWSSDDVAGADSGAATHWTFQDNGLEETVALDLFSPPPLADPPPLGSPPTPTPAPLLTGVGDIGGFRHDDLDVSPPDGMSANPIFGNTNSLDFAENAPLIVARVGTSSSQGGTGAYSVDGGTTWMPFAGAPAVTMPTGAKYVPPTAGSIAVSADGTTFVWAPQRGNSMSTPTASYSLDRGTTWTASKGLTPGMLVAADRVNPSKFYASNRGGMYVSTDGGATFVLVPMTTAASGRPRPVFGIEGDLWVPTGTGLLHSQDSGQTFQPPVAPVDAPAAVVDAATAVGFGMPATPGAYPAVYLAGSVNGVWGIYRSDNATDAAGATWQRIDDPQHQFGGYINCLAGDRLQAGRVYLGTSGRGIIYGDPQPQ